MNGMYDSHVHYFNNWKQGWKSHIVNGLRVGGYRWQWYIGLTPRRA